MYEVCKLDPVETEEEARSTGGKVGDYAWFPFAAVHTPMALRIPIRELRGRGYSEVSILVEGVNPDITRPMRER